MIVLNSLQSYLTILLGVAGGLLLALVVGFGIV